jgi:cardiolipin synthase (CMP-forming)
MQKIKENLNLPNLLSFCRIIAIPFILFFILFKSEHLFVVLIIICLITDILDGFFARLLDKQTEFGSRLDAYADIGMYLMAFIGIIVFKVNVLKPYFISLFIFVLVFLVPKIISYIKFKRFPSLHLYSSKIGGYLQGIFFVTLFVINFISVFYYIMIIWGIWSFIEQSIILTKISEMKSNVKGLYWVLKENPRK